MVLILDVTNHVLCRPIATALPHRNAAVHLLIGRLGKGRESLLFVQLRQSTWIVNIGYLKGEVPSVGGYNEIICY